MIAGEVSQIEYEHGPQGYIPIATTVPDEGHPEFSMSSYVTALDELNESFGIRSDPNSRHKFEVGVTNADKAGNGTILEGSTSSSSFTQNPGNSAEHAARAVIEPDKRRVYVAYAGNGGSTGFSLAEAIRIFKTGRLTMGEADNPEAYELYAAMARMLESHDLVPDQLSADVEGGRFVLGLTPALDPNTLKRVFLNGVPGMADGKGSYYQGMLQEDWRGHRERSTRSKMAGGEEREWDLDEMKKIAKNRLTRVYGTASNVARLLHTYNPYSLTKTLAPTLAYGNHANLDGPLYEHALAMDLLAMLDRHEVMATLQVNRDSKLHDPTQAIRFGDVVMNAIDPEIRSDNRGIKLIIEEGALDEHTNNPGARWRNERIALSSIASSIFAGIRFIQPEEIIDSRGRPQEA